MEQARASSALSLDAAEHRGRYVQARFVARRLGVSEETVHRWAMLKVIPCCSYLIPGRKRPKRLFDLDAVLRAGARGAEVFIHTVQPYLKPASAPEIVEKSRARKSRKAV